MTNKRLEVGLVGENVISSVVSVLVTLMVIVAIALVSADALYLVLPIILGTVALIVIFYVVLRVSVWRENKKKQVK